jgi:hypothetical protein
MDVMVLQRGDDASGWTTVGRGLAVDGRHTLLRVESAGRPAPGGRLRLVAVGAHGAAPARLNGVATLPRDGWTLTVARTTGPDRERQSAAVVLDALEDPADARWAAVAAAPTGPVPAAATIPEPAAALQPVPDEPPDAPLSWLCRLFGIDCPPPTVAG